MLSLNEAKNKAVNLTKLHGEKWIVMETSPDAPCNQYPANVCNTGPFIAVRRDEAMEYAAGGCSIADLCL